MSGPCKSGCRFTRYVGCIVRDIIEIGRAGCVRCERIVEFPTNGDRRMAEKEAGAVSRPVGRSRVGQPGCVGG